MSRTIHGNTRTARIATGLLNKLRSGDFQVIGVSGRPGFFQEDIRRLVGERGAADLEVLSFDIRDYSDTNDLVFTLLAKIIDGAAAYWKKAREKAVKLSKVLVYVGAGIASKAAGVQLADVEKALKFVEEQEGAEGKLNVVDLLRGRLRSFFSESGRDEKPLVVLITHLEEADEQPLLDVFYAVRYLRRVSEGIRFVIFFDDLHPCESATRRLCELCDCLIHLPNVNSRVLAQSVLRECLERGRVYRDDERDNVEKFIRGVSDLEGVSRATILRAVRHHVCSIELIRKQGFSLMYVYTLGLKYQFPDVYRLILQDERGRYRKLVEERRDVRRFVDRIESAHRSYYPQERQRDLFVLLRQIIRKGESAGL